MKYKKGFMKVAEQNEKMAEQLQQYEELFEEVKHSLAQVKRYEEENLELRHEVSRLMQSNNILAREFHALVQASS